FVDDEASGTCLGNGRGGELEPFGGDAIVRELGQESAGRATDVEPGSGRRERTEVREAVLGDGGADGLRGREDGVPSGAVRGLVMRCQLGRGRRGPEGNEPATRAAHERPANLDEETHGLAT